MEIVTIKGFGSGLGELAIAFAIDESLPEWQYLAIIKRKTDGFLRYKFRFKFDALIYIIR